MSTAWRNEPPVPGEVRPYTFPEVTRHRLSNGLTVLHARHGAVPVVGLRFVVAAGAAAEPSNRAGLARLMASTLDAGTELRDGPSLALELERIGIELETRAGWDAVDLEATVPASRLDPALSLLAEVARRAAFSPAEVERIRAEQAGQILLRRTEPRALADDAVLRFLFAEGTRYALPLIGTRDIVDRLGAAEVAGFHATLAVPSNSALVIVGALDAAAAVRAAEEHFGDWSASGAAPPPPDVRPFSRTAEVHVVHRADAVQSEIRIGHVSVARAHQDYVPLVVMNAILGGMFTSRLNLNLREKHGFTYGVRSGFGFRKTGGAFVTSTAVSTDVTARAVEELMGEIVRMRDDGATEGEVAAARDYMTGVMPLVLQTAGEVADALMELFIHDLPDDWHARHRADIGAVPADEIARVAREHLHPAAAAIVVAGDAGSIVEDLNGLGIAPVQRHDLEWSA